MHYERQLWEEAASDTRPPDTGPLLSGPSRATQSRFAASKVVKARFEQKVPRLNTASQSEERPLRG